MRNDRSRPLDRARRIDAVLQTLRRQAAARERERQTVPAELREAIADFGHELGLVRGRIRRTPSRRAADGTRT